MEIREFLKELAVIYPFDRKINEEQLNKIIEAYVEDILYEVQKNNGYELDYSKLFSYLRRHYTYKTFPSIAEVIKCIPNGLVPKAREYTPTNHPGSKLRVFLNSGEIREYVFTDFGKPFGVLKAELKNSDKVVKAIMYSPDVGFIGESICPQDAVGKVIYQTQ